MNAILQLAPVVEQDGHLELAATFTAAGRSERLWWRVPAVHRESLTTFADPFVVGFVYQMMKAGEDVEIRGPVSRSLLANLERYMEIWQVWTPAVCRRVRVWSREEDEPPPPVEPDGFVMPFSAGADSCFTAYRHARGQAGRNTRRIALGITMFGFDVLSHQPNARAVYSQVAQASAAMLHSLGIEHVELTSNFRDLSALWAHSYGAHLASGLHLFGRRFAGGLIANSLPVNQLDTVGGSHAMTDPLLGGGRFRIIEDGSATARWQKIAAIAPWPQAMAGLRVCFGGNGEIGNCGRCEKCIRTALAFRIADVHPPANLPAHVTKRQFRGIRLVKPNVISLWHDLNDGINARGKQHEPWAAGVRSVLRRSRRLVLSKTIRRSFIPLRDRVRTVFRGSPLSRRQTAAQTEAIR